MPVTKQILQILDRYLVEMSDFILQNQLLFLKKTTFHFKILILLNHSQSRLYSIWYCVIELFFSIEELFIVYFLQ
jgi:hypothetical protein